LQSHFGALGPTPPAEASTTVAILEADTPVGVLPTRSGHCVELTTQLLVKVLDRRLQLRVKQKSTCPMAPGT
jgi:hypothetical protein